MQTAFTGTIPLRGDLKLTLRHADTGLVKSTYEIRNTITYVALRSMVNLVSQKTTINPVDSKVAYLRLGTGVTAPTRSDLDLAIPDPFTISLGDAEKYLTTTNPFEMKILATVGNGDLNGLSLTEAGLFIRGGTVLTPPGSPAIYGGFYPELFARQIFPAIAKTVAFVLDVDWRVSFVS
jgi:hypothetical protein